MDIEKFLKKVKMFKDRPSPLNFLTLPLGQDLPYQCMSELPR
jgi:hypothetical protein